MNARHVPASGRTLDPFRNIHIGNGMLFIRHGFTRNPQLEKHSVGVCKPEPIIVTNRMLVCLAASVRENLLHQTIKISLIAADTDVCEFLLLPFFNPNPNMVVGRGTYLEYSLTGRNS